jgi:hypothetical protein
MDVYIIIVMKLFNYLCTLILYFFVAKWVCECEIGSFTLVICKVMRKRYHKGSTVLDIVVLYVIRDPLPFFFNVWKHSVYRFKTQFI